MSPVKVEKHIEDKYQSYAENPIETQVIEGYFQKDISLKSMAIRRVNKTLCGMLFIAIICAFVSYYFAMSNELTLNKLSRQITTLNDENAELQNHLDRLKSFNNVDDKMLENNILAKAAKVIEVQAVNPVIQTPKTSPKTASFDWSIGY